MTTTTPLPQLTEGEEMVAMRMRSAFDTTRPFIFGSCLLVGGAVVYQTDGWILRVDVDYHTLHVYSVGRNGNYKIATIREEEFQGLSPSFNVILEKQP